MEIQELINEISNDKNISIVAKSRYKIFCRPVFGSRKIISLPQYVAPESVFLAGMIIGDGHIRKDCYTISIELTNKEIILLLKEKIEKIFNINPKIIQVRDKRPNRQLRWQIAIRSKSIWMLFTKFFEIPAGKKSDIVEIPKIVLSSNLETKKEFMTGLFLADGGIKRKKSIAFTCSNKIFADQIAQILKEFDIGTWQSKWRSNISGKFVYDVMVERKDDIKKFKENFPLTELKLQGYPRLVKGA